MKEYKVWINYILFKLHIRKILPNKIIKRVKIVDNNEALCRLDCKKYNIILADRIKEPIYLRRSVCEKLYILAERLEKDNLRIKLYDAYRSLEEQKKSWDKRLEETRKENPGLEENEIVRLTKFKVAKIDDVSNAMGHQTGGAVDITLVNKDGVELDLGTSYEEYNDKTLTYSKNISKEALKNRKLLLKEMKKLGFVNFPAEWWHYCYGDKMWAAYLGKKEAIYGYKEVE